MQEWPAQDGAHSVETERQAAMTLRIALAQQAAGPDRADNLRRALLAMERAHAAGAGLIVFPEVGLERFFPQHPRLDAARLAEPIPGPISNAVRAKAAELALVTVLNLYEADEQGGGRYFDSSPV